MRFDDSLSTVLSADTSTRFGAAATWRQLVDLMGRGRVAVTDEALNRLRALRSSVPAEVRAASARAVALAGPEAALVGLFAEDELAVAAPVLRTAMLPAEHWLALLPRLSPSTRSVLRHRRDLPGEVGRALASFGSVDFVLEGAPAPLADDGSLPAAEPSQPEPLPPLTAPLSETPFVALGAIARALPLVAEARRRTAEPVPAPNGYAISDLVARIDAFTRRRAGPTDIAEEAIEPPRSFQYRTDAEGVVRWIEGVSRGALIGLSFAAADPDGPAQVDGSVPGAFRRRSRFADARLVIGGASDAAGAWRLSGMPVFDPASGRFLGYEGSARRPRTDETAEPRMVDRAGADSLRQLMHELRTPANAIAGFAELIESELLGPVSPVYRERAGAIRSYAADLIAAIEDLDTAARIEVDALDLRERQVDALALVTRLLDDLQPLATLRGVVPWLSAGGPASKMAVDDRAVERLVGRLLAAVLSAGARDEVIGITVSDADTAVLIAIDRPRALIADESAIAHDDAEPAGAPLLGTAFALRLARRLAGELGGGLVIGEDRLTLRLPAALDREVGQTTKL